VTNSIDISKNVPCIACRGEGKRSHIEGYITPCPYCNGTKVQPSEEENISVGKRARLVFSNRVGDGNIIQLPIKRVW